MVILYSECIQISHLMSVTFAITSCDLYSASGFWVGKTSLQLWKKLLSVAVLDRQKDEVDRGKGEETELKNDQEDLVNPCLKKESVVSLLTDSEGEACQQQVCQQEACQQETCQQEACQLDVCQEEACQQSTHHLGTCRLEDCQPAEKNDNMEVTESRLEKKEGDTSLLSSPSERGLGAVVESCSSVKEDTGSFNEDVLCIHGVYLLKCVCEGVCESVFQVQ